MQNKGPKGISILIIGNKSDLGNDDRRQVDYTDAQQFAAKQGFEYVETSALDGSNVDSAFNILVN